MRILHVVRTLDRSSGGPVEGLTQRGLELARRGHAVEVASLDPAVDSFPLPTHPLGPALGKYGYASRLKPWLQERAGGFDAVVVNGLWQYHSFGAWRALRALTVPYVVFPHGMLDPWFKRRHPLKHLKKCLYWPWAERRVLRDAAAVLFTSEDERDRARTSFPWSAWNERVVAYGTAAPPEASDGQRSAFLDAFPQARGARLLLFLGRVHRKKGCDLLLRAFAECASAHPDLRLVMAGPDPDGLQPALMRESGADPARVVWTGMLQGQAKWGAFRSAEAFMLPSHQENFGLAVCEALGCGVPVLISTSVNIWREIVADGAGLAEPDDLDGTRRLLLRWLELSGEKRAAMAASAAGAFARRFRIERSADALIAVLEDVIGARRGGVR